MIDSVGACSIDWLIIIDISPTSFKAFACFIAARNQLFKQERYKWRWGKIFEEREQRF